MVSPVFPNKKRLLAITTLLSLFISSLIALLKEKSSRKIFSIKFLAKKRPSCDISTKIWIHSLQSNSCSYKILQVVSNGESKKKLNDIKSPVLVMHGRKDNIVPFYMGQQIYEALSSVPKFAYFNDQDDHMMEYNKELIASIKKFLEQIN